MLAASERGRPPGSRRRTGAAPMNRIAYLRGPATPWEREMDSSRTRRGPAAGCHVDIQFCCRRRRWVAFVPTPYRSEDVVRAGTQSRAVGRSPPRATTGAAASRSAARSRPWARPNPRRCCGAPTARPTRRRTSPCRFRTRGRSRSRSRGRRARAAESTSSASAPRAGPWRGASSATTSAPPSTRWSTSRNRTKRRSSSRAAAASRFLGGRPGLVWGASWVALV